MGNADYERHQAWARQSGDAIEIDELKAEIELLRGELKRAGDTARALLRDSLLEIERLSLRQLTLYDVAGEEVFTMTIGPRGSRWRAAENKPIDTPITRIEIS
jgi:hypothetical protein